MNIIPESRPVVAIEGREAYLVIGYTLNQGAGHTVVVDSHGTVSVLVEDSRLVVLRCFDTALQADAFMGEYMVDPEVAEERADTLLEHWDVLGAATAAERFAPKAP